jgi:hypothetical protein
MKQQAKGEPFHKYLDQYRAQLQKGAVRAAYKGLMGYLQDLRLHLKTGHPDFFVSGIQFGHMDFTYFYFFPKAIKRQNLKIVILFVHDTFRFEVWLAGYNKATQAKYWKLFMENGWNKAPLAPTTKGTDYIVQSVLVDNPDFSNLSALTNQIEKGALKFIDDVEGFLAAQKTNSTGLQNANRKNSGSD